MGGEQKTINNTHPRFKQIIAAVKKGDEAEVKNLLSVKRQIEKYGEGYVTYKNGLVYYKGKQVENYLTRKIVQMQKEGFTIKPLLRFLENLMDNPSYRARKELYGFLEYGNLPITPDGYFIAYKKVSSSYKDLYTGTIDNSIGAKPEMDRKDVDDDSSVTCSEGLHFASREYMSSYGISGGNLVMAVKINPRDVVSIPADYNNTKGRACLYEVVAELGKSDNFDYLEESAMYGEEPDYSEVDTTTKEPSTRPEGAEYDEARKYKGVTWDKHSKKFKAQVQRKGKKIHLGLYTKAKKAHKAYKKFLKSL